MMLCDSCLDNFRSSLPYRSDEGKDSPGRRPQVSFCAGLVSVGNIILPFPTTQNAQSRSVTDLHIATTEKSPVPKQSPEKKKKPVSF